MKRPQSERRIVSIWFPSFPLERWWTIRRGTVVPPSDRALVLALDSAQGPIVYAVSPGARDLGVCRGARVVDMQALVPDLVVLPAEREADAEALVRLAHWSRRWACWTAPDGPDGLLLDMSRPAGFWTSDAAMLEAMETAFLSLGLSARLAVAPTIGAAWGLARFGDPRARVCTPERLDIAVDPLRIEALRVRPETVLLLRRLGLRHVGALRSIPERALEKRFRHEGTDLLLRLAQMTGEADEPLVAVPERPRPAVRRELPSPIFDAAPMLPEMAAELGARLDDLGHAAHRLRLSIFRTDGETRVVDVACPSVRPSEGLARLFDGRLGELDPGWGFDHVMLEALVSEPVRIPRGALRGVEPVGAGVRNVSNSMIVRVSPRTAGRSEPVGAGGSENSVRSMQPMALRAETAPVLDQPLRLFDPPEEVRVTYLAPAGPPALFVWNRQSFRVVCSVGPEHTSTREPHARHSRAYFKVQVPDGRRFWIYRDGTLSEGRDAMPRWFVHGVFA